MFFEDQTIHTKADASEWKHLLIRLARIQREVITLLCDPEQGMLDTDAWKSDAYRQALRRMDACREEAADYAKQHTLPLGVYWWNVSWDLVETCLLKDLLLEPDTSNYRFRRDWFTENDGGKTMLFLNEHVHYQKFTGSSSTSYGIASAYSAEEIQERLREYNRNITALDLLFLGGSKSIQYSEMDQTYYEGAAWMGSTDYIFQRMALDNLKRIDLYSEKTTHHLSVSGTSFNRDTVYLTGGYEIRNGTLRAMQIFPYNIVKRSGGKIPGLPDPGAGRAPCLAAWKLAEDRNLQRVPLELITDDLKTPAHSFDQAVFLAEVVSCLADKLDD